MVSKDRPPPKRRWLVPTLLLTLVAGGGGWWAWRSTHPTASPTAGLITASVKRGDLIEAVSATGSVTAQTGAQVKIGSQITGRIKKLSADVGSQVKAGQVIAELDLPDIQAQLRQARANLAVAQVKLLQQESGVAMQQTQLSSAITQAEAGQTSAKARLTSAQAAADLQRVQTPSEIERTQNGVASAVASLATARSNLAQTTAGTQLQVANTQQQVNQAQASATNSALFLKRQQQLLVDGFVAASVVDQAQANASVDRSLVIGAQQNLVLVEQKNTADLQAGRDLLTQAEQGVKTANAALTVAQAGTFLNTVKRADVGDARAALREGVALLRTAQGNSTQNLLKQQDVSQARAAVQVAEAQVAYAQAQADKTVIRSPITGTVLQLASQQGETLAAGLSSPTLIVVADLNRLQIDTYVDETDIGKVRLKQPCTVTVDAFSGRSFPGHVAKIASGSTIQQGVITYDVTVALDSLDAKYPLKPDMTASVTIQTGTRTGVLLVPSEAVKNSTSGVRVTVLTTKDGQAKTTSRTVTTGATDGVSTEILTGVREGDIVVLAGALKVVAATKSGSAFGMGARRGGSSGGGGGSRGGGGPQ